MPRDSAADLRARGLRVTPQRRAILDAFSERADEHLSADEVHARAAAVVPEISRGTVYSTLAELTELGMVAALGSPEPVRYETNTEPHQHFRCRLCLRLFDVDLPTPSVDAFTAAGFIVEGVSITAEGVCVDCRDYARGLTAGIDAVHATAQLGSQAVSQIAAVCHETRFGPLLIAASTGGIARIAFEQLADFAPLAARAKSRRGSRNARARVDHLVGSLEAYLAGEREQADDVIDWGMVSETSRSALEATMRIPYGQQRSYHRVCTAVSAYECGYAMGSNPFPIFVPCHRVTRGTEMPEAYVGGQQRRIELNRLEADPVRTGAG